MARQKAPQQHFNAIEGSSCRVHIMTGYGGMHGLEMTFKTDSGDDIVVTMPHHIARELLNSSIAAYGAIMQPLQIARTVPFG